MDAAQRVLIERDCERLVTAYCQFVDHGQADRVPDLFAENGTWCGPGAKMTGQKELRDGFASRQADAMVMSRHICNNLLVEVIDEDHATGCAYLTLYRHEGKPSRRVSPLDGPLLVGEYRDRFVRTDTGWKFETRDLEICFMHGLHDDDSI